MQIAFPLARRAGLVLAVLGLIGLLVAGGTFAQSGSRTFPQTGHTLSGGFLAYWQAHGGLAQQGYPISEPFTETSDLNGRPYAVQYFERAVFEYHPENNAPYDILLSQLGTLRYRQKYGDAGASGQHPNLENSRVFTQTGHTVGGDFRSYWESHGGLIQQGYPISEEFTEVSDLNGRPYTVQYFQRAVFERHPENGPPYRVLLSLLGTFQQRAKYPGGVPTPPPGSTPLGPPGAATPALSPPPAAGSGTPAPGASPTAGSGTPAPGASPTAESGTPAPAGSPTASTTPGPLDLLAQADAAMNSLTALKQHAVNQATNNLGTTIDIGDYLYQAPDRLHLTVLSPRPGQPVTPTTELIRIGPARYERTNLGDPAWRMSTDTPPYVWPTYQLADVAQAALSLSIAGQTTLNGEPATIVHLLFPLQVRNVTAVDYTADLYIATTTHYLLRQVETRPGYPGVRDFSSVDTSDFFDFNQPNMIEPPPGTSP